MAKPGRLMKIYGSFSLSPTRVPKGERPQTIVSPSLGTLLLWSKEGLASYSYLCPLEARLEAGGWPGAH